MGTLWSTNIDERHIVKPIRSLNTSPNEDPISSEEDIFRESSEEPQEPPLAEEEKRNIAAKRLAYLNTRYQKKRFEEIRNDDY